MRKVFLTLQRLFLALGILVALTPCAMCPKTGASHAATPCSMGHMNGKASCCHQAKSSNPFCKMMDQSSVQTAKAQADAAVVSAVSAVVPGPPVLTAPWISSAFPSGCSPPRSSPVLRI